MSEEEAITSVSLEKSGVYLGDVGFKVYHGARPRS